jgi:4-amino-4-deoxy-L-arabinose transferase-like glycosyltransferase
VALALGIVWAFAVEPLNAPDEPAHIQAILQVRNYGILPEVHYDFSRVKTGQVVNTPVDQDVVTYTRSHGLTVQSYLDPNESTQPPLYYLLLGTLTRPLPPDPPVILYTGRLVNALLGALLVFVCYAAVRELAPDAPIWALAVAGAIALLPQFSFNRASVSNDTLVNLLAMTAFYLWIRSLKDPKFDRWMLASGTVVALALLTRLNAVALLPGLAMVFLFRVFQEQGSHLARLKRAGIMAAALTVTILGLFGWWLVRNMFVYGSLTGLDSSAIQYARANYTWLDLSNPTIRTNFIVSSWDSFWGIFGWMHIHLRPTFYQYTYYLILAAVGASLLAAIVFAVRRIRGRSSLPAYAWQAVLAMAAVTAALLVGYVQFSATFAYQPQGRYLFMALLPIFLLFTGGTYFLLPGRLMKVLAFAAFALWLAIMNVAGLLIA